jgi:AcrR family transcriptional regulator
LSSSKPSKREITRQKVINAAIDCIYKEGFNAAHTNKIAKEAGVSWGVLQYHFGDKDTLLQAVLDAIFAQFFSTISEARLDGKDLHSRVAQLIDVIWGLVSHKEYRVSVAILRNAGKDKDSKINGQKQIKQWASQMSDLWNSLLKDDIGN